MKRRPARPGSSRPANPLPAADRARTAQTKAFLTKRFAAAGVHPKSRFGQNFLIDLNLHRLLVDSAEVDDRDVVLEVGAGDRRNHLVARGSGGRRGGGGD